MASVTWLLATGNQGKVVELAQILEPYGVHLKTLADLHLPPDCPETGQTFLENAIQKARTYQRDASMPVWADDSGLEIDALDGAPGIHSARFGGFPTHAEKRKHVLELLADTPSQKRSARFQCAAVFFDGTRVLSCQASLEGFIGFEERGSLGFGYDPIFCPSLDGPSMAEMDLNEKNRISHRGKAFWVLARAIFG